MKKKILWGTLGISLALCVTGCGSKSKEANATEDLTKIYASCLDQNEGYTCRMNWTLQEYFANYSSYRLLNTSKKEFTVKPKDANSQFTYGSSRDSVCAYDYALFYNSDNDTYYSVTLECEGNESDPVFKDASLLK